MNIVTCLPVGLKKLINGNGPCWVIQHGFVVLALGVRHSVQTTSVLNLVVECIHCRNTLLC